MNQSLSVSGNKNPYYLGLKESKTRKKIYMYIKTCRCKEQPQTQLKVAQVNRENYKVA